MKIKTFVWVTRNDYLQFNSILALKQKPVSTWMQEKITNYLNKEHGKHQAVSDNRATDKKDTGDN